MAGIPNALIPFLPDNSFARGVEVSFIRSNVDIKPIRDLMTNLKQVVKDSFGQLAKIESGKKLSSQTYGHVGNSDFAITIHLEGSVTGLARSAWNVTAYVANTFLPVTMSLTGASIDQNIRDIRKAVDHLLISYEKAINTLCEAPYTKADPVFATIQEINETLVRSNRGVRQLLITYIKDRMPNVHEIKNQLGDDPKGEKLDETIYKIALCLEMIFRLEHDADFHTFCLHKQRENSPNNNESDVISHFLTASQRTVIKLTLSPLNTDLKTFFPDNVAHTNQLRSIGKLVERIRKIQATNKPTDDEVEALIKITNNLRHIDGSNQDPRIITYPDGSYWDETDRQYHYKHNETDYTSTTKFTEDELTGIKSMK